VLEVTLAQALELGLRVKVGEVVLDKEPLAVVLVHGEEEPQCEGVGVGLPLLVPLGVRLPLPVPLLELQMDVVAHGDGEAVLECELVTVALRHKLLVPDLVGLLLLLLLPLTLKLMEMVPDVVELALRLPVLHSVGLRDGVSVALEELH